MKRSLLVLMTACASTSDPVRTNEAAHTAGAPIVDAPSVMWANESFEDFVSFGPNEGAVYLPRDHPLVVRMQFWADAIYEAATALQPGLAQRVPSPKIAIETSDVQNAWVSSIPTGWPMDAHVDGTTASEAGHLDLTPFGVVRHTTIAVREMIPPAAEVDSWLEFMNQRFEDCRVARAGEALLLSGCRLSASASAGGHLQLHTTSRWVTMTTGRISYFHSEYENVASLAHELGHYFRAHPAVPVDSYNYFYSLDDRSPQKPAPDPRFVAESRTARDKIISSLPDFTTENALMQNEHLGFYTTEQEADELGMELLSRIGMSPDLIAQKQLHAMQNGPELAHCTQLRAAGWKDAAGNPVSVPVGSPSDPHHDNCFRVFNADREQSIHHYVPVGTPPVPPGDWEEALAAIPQ